jgi:hypothetical protein
MGVNIGKQERTYNSILEVLVTLRKKYPSSWITNVDVARKTGIHPATATRYLNNLWRRGEVLRARTVGKSLAYRRILPGEDLERYKTDSPEKHAWQAFVRPTKGKVNT